MGNLYEQVTNKKSTANIGGVGRFHGKQEATYIKSLDNLSAEQVRNKYIEDYQKSFLNKINLARQDAERIKGREEGDDIKALKIIFGKELCPIVEGDGFEFIPTNTFDSVGGVDMVLSSSTEDQSAKSVAIKFSFNNKDTQRQIDALQDRFNKCSIGNMSPEKALSQVKYFQKEEDAGFEKLDKLPKVIIGIDKTNLEKLYNDLKPTGGNVGKRNLEIGGFAYDVIGEIQKQLIYTHINILKTHIEFIASKEQIDSNKFVTINNIILSAKQNIDNGDFFEPYYDSLIEEYDKLLNLDSSEKEAGSRNKELVSTYVLALKSIEDNL